MAKQEKARRVETEVEVEVAEVEAAECSSPSPCPLWRAACFSPAEEIKGNCMNSTTFITIISYSESHRLLSPILNLPVPDHTNP